MQPDVAPTIRNFNCSFCTSNFDSIIGEQAYLDSVTILIRTPLLVIVERYDESMDTLGDFDRLMHDFQSRCRLLSVATLPNNAVEIAESNVS